jgi:PEP-CTERM motif
MKILAYLLSLAVLSFADHASARVINFDNLSGENLIPKGYSGLHWSKQFFYIDGLTYPIAGTGYTNGVVSPPNVAFNGSGLNVSFGRKTAFELDSFDITSAWRNGMSVTVTGELNGVTVDSTTFKINVSGPTLETFDWDVNEVSFHAFGGKSAFGPRHGRIFVLDNLTIGAVPALSPAVSDGAFRAVPEPSTWAMMLLGFAGLGYAGYRRLKSGNAALLAG